MRNSQLRSEPPTRPERQVPPYLPTFSTGSTMRGFLGRRSATGGSVPAFTCSASAGASLKSIAIADEIDMMPAMIASTLVSRKPAVRVPVGRPPLDRRAP